MIFQHSQCFQCFQCSKKRGTPLKNPPLLRTQFAINTAQGAHKFHKGETARQGRQHSAGGAHKLHKGETARQGRQHRGSAQTPQGRNSTAGATAQRRGSAQTPRGRHSTAGATAQCRGAHKLHRAARHGKSDSSGKQERGRQALRSCDFGGRCSGNL